MRDSYDELAEANLELEETRWMRGLTGADPRPGAGQTPGPRSARTSLRSSSPLNRALVPLYSMSGQMGRP